MTVVGIIVEDEEVIDGLGRLRARVDDLVGALVDRGEYLLRAHDRRLDAQRAPEGTPWARLRPRYGADKARRRPRAGILMPDA